MNAVINESLEAATLGNANALEPRVRGAMIPADPASSTYFDVLAGVVVARNGHRLAVRGATLVLQDGSVRMPGRDIIVTMGAATVVAREDDVHAELDTDAIVVGERIIVFGDACEGQHGVEIDAIEGHIRLVMAGPHGRVAAKLVSVGRESGGAGSGSVAAEAQESAGLSAPFGLAQGNFDGDDSVEGSALRATLGVSNEILAYERRRHRPCVGRARPR